MPIAATPAYVITIGATFLVCCSLHSLKVFACGAAILILKTKEDKVLYVNKRTSV
jgi:hypothetical protein